MLCIFLHSNRLSASAPERGIHFADPDKYKLIRKEYMK